MLKALRRQGDNSNTVIGIILLVMLLVYVGPDVLPTLLSRTFPFLDEGVPCSRLRTAQDRATHQSLIGRQAINPLTLRTEVPPFPADPEDTWVIRIIIQNDTIGSIPVVYDNQVRIGIGSAPDSSGPGLVFSNNVVLQRAQPQSNQGTASFPLADIRLLGPRQKCVIRVEIPRATININGQASVRSYYRINTAGTVQSALFPDQGLAIIEGQIVQSEDVPITFTAAAN